MKIMCATACASLCLAIGTPAFANILTNGDFSSSPPGNGCAAGVTSIPSWSVIHGNIDVLSASPPNCPGAAAPSGSTYYVDLTGSFAEDGQNDVGTIAQSLSTAVGSEYNVSFYFGGNSQWQYTSYPNDGPVKSMEALVNNLVVNTYSVNTAGASYTNAQWQLENFDFTALSPVTTLSFSSLNGISSPSDYGAFLADVQVNKVPEPATLALFGTGVFGLLLAVTRKKRRA